MHPVILRLGTLHLGSVDIPVAIYSYGLMMAIAFLTAGYLTGKELTRKGFEGELAWTMMFWAAVGGLGGSRILAIVDDWSGYVADPIHGIFSGAGFVWYGGLIGGFLAVSWVIYRHALPWLVAVDCIAPGLALAHAIGRIGCQLAGDGCWGRETTLPWGMAYPNAIVGWNYPPGVCVHPTPVYEMLAYGAIFTFLWSIRRRPHANGTLFWWYLVLGPTARFLVEFVRINPPVVAGLSQAQLISLALVAIGVWRLLAGAAPANHKAAAASLAKR